MDQAEYFGFDHLVKVNPYGVTARFVTSRELFAAYTGTALTEDQDGCCQFMLARREYVIGIFDCKQSTLVHECTHAAVFILTNVGIDVRSNNAEPLAYLVGWLYEQFAPVCGE